MKELKKASKIEPKFQLADEFLDLKTVKPGALVEHLEEQIKLRALSVEKRFKKSVLK